MVNRSQEFSGSNDIDKFFTQFNSSGFVDWFNKNISSDSIWGIAIKKQENWHKVWASIKDLFGKSSINLIEFLCINSIIINETGGNFVPLTENVGSSGNPGLSYAFNKISGTKKSYNTLSTNKTALNLFNDPLYIAAHSTKPFGSLLKNTNDHRWDSDVFPIGFSGNPTNETNISGKLNGFIYEADFMKFRGRGYIQLTGRENYKSLINFVKSYTGNNAIINSIKNNWSTHTNIDDIATISTNQQWDDLFQKTDSIVANYACYIHSTLPSQYKNYNIINPNQSDVNLNKSIYNVGLAVSGSSNYAKEFQQRVLLQLKVLDSAPSTPISPTASQAIAFSQEQEGRAETTGQDPSTQTQGNNITGSISSVTNLFKPTAKPGPISFDMSGNG